MERVAACLGLSETSWLIRTHSSQKGWKMRMKNVDNRTVIGGGMHGGRVTEYAEMWHHNPAQIVDFSANINPNGPPVSVQQAVAEAMGSVMHYPDARQWQVKQVLAAYHGCSPEQLVVGNGATEVMELLWRWLMPKRTLIFTPAFGEYAAIPRRLRLQVQEIPIPAKLWQDPVAVLNAMGQAKVLPGDLVVFNNPHNPTGTRFTRVQWQATVARWLEKGAWVFMDEAFLDFLSLPEQNATSGVFWADNHRQLAILRSATKVLSIPGLRFGYGITGEKWASQVNQNRDGWSVNSLAQAAATAGFQDQKFFQNTHQWLTEELAYVRQHWEGDPRLQLFPLNVNFFLTRMSTPDMATFVYDQLARQGLFLRSCASFTGLGTEYLRVAVRSRVDNQRLWALVSQLLNGLL
ncbi:aminotransferase class I/II-fold pyridoxal phosphate-dependent enzyme [Alicyclobacillaceae bacterium I2511]|nr:aminotransferase class I/II-fold pyridoxal phosphate-dependent enzyme [Alicyclobacillaceae bacterium I2511]